MPDIYDLQDEADRERLRAAGWTQTEYSGGEAWVSPDKRECVSRAEALKRLERKGVRE